jgi:hypothetical protein
MDQTAMGAGNPASDAAATPAGRPGDASGTTYALLGALLAALLFARHPDSLLHPQFWAEDGTLFFQSAFNEGFWGTLLQPAAGYLHTLPRLVAGLSLLLPLEHAPLVFNSAAFLVQLAPALYLLSPRMSATLPALAARAAAALLLIALPASSETHVNMTNAHWHLTLTAVFILGAAPPAGRGVRALETLVLLLFALTGPFSLLCLPVVAQRLIGLAKGVSRGWHETLALMVAAGALIQAGCALTSTRLAAAAATPGALTPGELATVVSMHTFYNALFGINGLSSFYASLPPAAYGLGLVALGCLLALAIRDRVRPLLIIFFLAACSIALSFAFPLNDPRLWLHPLAGPRYFFFAIVFVYGSLLHLALAGGALRPVGIALLALGIAGGVRADFFHPRQPDVRWRDNIAVFRSLPAGADFSVPVTPLFFPSMVLHKSTADRGPSPLARLRPLPTTTPAEAAISRPERVLLTQVVNDRFLSVSGWAIDGAAGSAAGGVFIQIDEKLFPAVYGLRGRVEVDGRTYADCGFTRLIPLAEIGRGAHRLSLVVLTGDGQSAFQATPRRLFATGEFFP